MKESVELRPATVEAIDGIAATIVDSARYHHGLDRDPYPYQIPPGDEVIRDVRAG